MKAESYIGSNGTSENKHSVGAQQYARESAFSSLHSYFPSESEFQKGPTTVTVTAVAAAPLRPGALPTRRPTDADGRPAANFQPYRTFVRDFVL